MEEYVKIDDLIYKRQSLVNGMNYIWAIISCKDNWEKEEFENLNLTVREKALAFMCGINTHGGLYGVLSNLEILGIISVTGKSKTKKGYFGETYKARNLYKVYLLDFFAFYNRLIDKFGINCGLYINKLQLDTFKKNPFLNDKEREILNGFNGHKFGINDDLEKEINIVSIVFNEANEQEKLKCDESNTKQLEINIDEFSNESTKPRRYNEL